VYIETFMTLNYTGKKLCSHFCTLAIIFFVGYTKLLTHRQRCEGLRCGKFKKYEVTERLDYTLGISCKAVDSEDYIRNNCCCIYIGKLQTSFKIREFRQTAWESSSKASLLVPYVLCSEFLRKKTYVWTTASEHFWEHVKIVDNSGRIFLVREGILSCKLESSILVISLSIITTSYCKEEPRVMSYEKNTLKELRLLQRHYACRKTDSINELIL